VSRFIPVEPEKWGQMVKAWADNARLETEVERLKAELFKLVATDNEEICRLQDEVEELKSQPDPLTAYLYADTLRRDDIKTLKAHIERLTKAGDAMALSLEADEAINGIEGHTPPSVQAWRDATQSSR
jgi:predicted RNase H-like nuclease (RuvC/YqgF family)